MDTGFIDRQLPRLTLRAPAAGRGGGGRRVARHHDPFGGAGARRRQPQFDPFDTIRGWRG